MRFEEERAFRKSRESEQGEQHVPTPQVVSQVPSVQLTGSQVTGASTSRSSSYEDRPVWEQSSRKKKPKWLQDTLKEAQEFGTPKDPVTTIQMPDRLGMALVASLRDSEPSTFEEASQHHVW